jgi:hypothetical protein
MALVASLDDLPVEGIPSAAEFEKPFPMSLRGGDAIRSGTRGRIDTLDRLHGKSLEQPAIHVAKRGGQQRDGRSR